MTSFNLEMLERLKAWYPIDSRFFHLPPALTFSKNQSSFSLRNMLGLSPKLSDDKPQQCDFILLLAAGLRPVKDVMFLLDSFIAWRKQNPHLYFVCYSFT